MRSCLGTEKLAPTILFSLTLTFTILLSFITPTTAQIPITTGVTATAAAATARTSTKWYILGGTISTDENAAKSAQFLALDLTSSWTVASPPWTFLSGAGTPQQDLFPATFSADEQNMFAYHLPNTTKVGQYSVAQHRWVDSKTEFAGSGNQGIGVVTDTNTGYIYITGGYSDVTVTNIEKYHPDRPGVVAKIPFPTVTGFVARWYAGNVFCKTRGSILYFGGYNGASQLDPDANIVTEFNVTTSQFSTLPTKGPRPAMRADHCMSISEDSTRIVVYGGRLNNGVTGTIHILDLNTLVWTAGEMGEARSYPSCVLSGDNVVVWGGKNAAPQPGAPEPIVKIPLLIYSISRNAWVDTYYPPGTPISVGPSGTGSTPPPTTTGGANSKSSNTGAVVGGVISGLAAICAVVGLLWWRRRKHQRGGGDMKRPFLVKPSTAHTPGSDPDENKALGSGDYTSNTTTMTAAAGVGYDTPSKNHKSPQAVVESNPDLEWTLRDIENQQMQLDLKRQLLALQQQEQHLRGPLPPLSSASAPITSTQQYSPPQYHQPKSGPQTSIVGTPSSPTMSAFSVGGSSVFGNKRQSSYELHNLKPYPSPPGATKQTVHTLPDSLVTPHPYKHHGDAGVISGLAARPESQMYQDAAEPSYGPSPVAVPSWYPGLEYQDGAIHNGVGWVRQAKGPHAVLERGASVAGVPTGVQQEGSATGYHN